MPAYRFYRPEDVPKLARGVDACWRAHFPEEPEMTPERFRREMKVLDLWPSSCMMATEGDDAIAIVVGAKRKSETAILRVATRPDHLRQGHAAHVLDSLRRKLAVLGPPRLVAEVPRRLEPAVALFGSLGWRRESSFVDLLVSGDDRDGRDSSVVDVPAADLLALAEPPSDAAWMRSRQTLVQSGDGLRGLAIPGTDGFRAWILAVDEPRPAVLAHAVSDAREAGELLGGLAGALAGSGEAGMPSWRSAPPGSGRAVRFPRLSVDDPVTGELLGAGARVEQEVDRWAIEAATD